MLGDFLQMNAEAHLCFMLQKAKTLNIEVILVLYLCTGGFPSSPITLKIYYHKGVFWCPLSLVEAATVDMCCADSQESTLKYFKQEKKKDFTSFFPLFFTCSGHQELISSSLCLLWRLCRFRNLMCQMQCRDALTLPHTPLPQISMQRNTPTTPRPCELCTLSLLLPKLPIPVFLPLWHQIIERFSM